MLLKKIKLYINTIYHLKFIQVYYRFIYFFKKKINFNKNYYNVDSKYKKLNWTYNYFAPMIYNNNSLFFLNKNHNFINQIDWNFNSYGKLWTYNLNYFDFLNQKEMDKKTGLKLIRDYIKKDSFLKEGKEPYPISLRGINWIKFLSFHRLNILEVNKILFNHYMILYKNIEYQLLGNHILENGFSLLFASYYFENDKFYKKAKNLLIDQLNEQILDDGAHFELSPMYHQIIFSRLLDSINLINLNKKWKNDELAYFLKEKSKLMYSWLKNITYKNGHIPMVNDSTFDIAPESNILFKYADKMDISPKKISLKSSGYRKINMSNYELFLDVDIGPDYQPGHAHSDTFSFELVSKKT